MRKLLVCAVLIALLAIGAESNRMPRQAEEEGDVAVPVEEEVVAAPAEEEAPAPAEEEAAPAPSEEEAAPLPAEEEAAAPHSEEHSVASPSEEQGPTARVMSKLRSYYDQTLQTASGYLEDIKGLKLEEKAKNLYVETSSAVQTYAGVVQDQLYHMMGTH